MNARTLRLGTRGSALALAQSGMVAEALTAATGVPVELVPIRTRGDAITDRPLDLIGGKGLFTKEIETALLQGEIDLAVHSMKDLPGDMPEGLVIGATPPRADPRDAVVGGTLAALAPGAIVGTGSARRRLQILSVRPDLDVRGVRGNVDTRIQKQHCGEYAAVVLAAAGLIRLRRLAEADELLDVDAMIPAPGQGILAVQCRRDDGGTRSLLATLHDGVTGRCADAERGFLLELSGGCSIPAACHARDVGDELRVTGLFADDTGLRRASLTSPGRPAIE
jgi:hydroxymethylbilane synthase